MKRYFDHIQTKEPHERRQHAMRLAGAVTAAVFAVWITTLGLRLGGSGQLAQDDGTQTSLSASAAQSMYGAPNQLMVVPGSSF
jgi:hypothetical protein